jgi:Tol biopolymer transport system component
MKSDGTDAGAVTNDVGGNFSPVWSPDGTRILFTSARGAGNPQIWVMDADGTDQARVTDGDGTLVDAAWSPDGSKITFTHFGTIAGDKPDIYVINADRSGLTNLTATPAFGEVTPAWSPDGTKIATQQQDERQVGDMYLVETPVNGGHPTLRAWKYPLAGDEHVAMITRVVIDVDTGKVTRLLTAQDYHRAMDEDDLDMGEYLWSPDGTRLGFVSTDRFHRWSTAKVADTTTGEVRTLFTETEKTHVQTRVQWQIFWDTNEVLWYSQRDGYAQMYLYDFTTGRLKNPITTGGGMVTRVVRIDHPTRTMWYEAVGKEPGQDPYFTHLY